MMCKLDLKLRKNKYYLRFTDYNLLIQYILSAAFKIQNSNFLFKIQSKICDKIRIIYQLNFILFDKTMYVIS